MLSADYQTAGKRWGLSPIVLRGLTLPISSPNYVLSNVESGGGGAMGTSRPTIAARTPMPAKTTLLAFSNERRGDCSINHARKSSTPRRFSLQTGGTPVLPPRRNWRGLSNFSLRPFHRRRQLLPRQNRRNIASYVSAAGHGVTTSQCPPLSGADFTTRFFKLARRRLRSISH